MSDAAEKRVFVKKDWADLRDLRYRPGLSNLKRQLAPMDVLRESSRGGRRRELVFGIRNQDQSPKCVGFALAALIDLQRWQQHAADGEVGDAPDIVSADMLYAMARFHDRYPEDPDDPAHAAEGVRSLRAAIKGFYHHGVCLDDRDGVGDLSRWSSDCYQKKGHPDFQRRWPTVDQAKAARGIGLGAYYRVDPILNHFHAALNDAGQILVSANTHDGWNTPVDGVIRFENYETGTHAFVIVGYDERGFLVLNSWGDGWGGYAFGADKRRLPGIALWTYDDWARHLVDAWVLRLGVSAPSAFDKSVGEHGADRFYGQIESRTPPCFELVGHFMHLDDGRHVAVGSYPSAPDLWPKTDRYLRDHLSPDAAPGTGSDYRGILLWISGSLEGIKPAFEAAAQRKNEIKSLALYPYTLFWCAQFVEKSMEVLGTVFETCEKRAGADQRTLDAMIEASIRGIGRAFWRDIERGARAAVLTPSNGDPIGPAARLVLDMLRLSEETSTELHIVADGTGALLLDALLEHLPALGPAHGVKLAKRPIADRLATLSLVMPAIGVAEADRRILPLVAAMNSRGGVQHDVASYDAVMRRWMNEKGELLSEPPDRRDALPARIYVPTPELESRVRFSSYGKSILHLVANAFAEREPAAGGDGTEMGPPPRFLGMSAAAPDESKAASAPEFSRIRRTSDPRFETGLRSIPQIVLSSDPSLAAEIFLTVDQSRRKAKRKRTPRPR